MKNEYASDIEVDKYALDIEWERQPHTYMKWAEKLAKAILDRDRIKQQLDILKAHYNKIYRAQLEKELGKKPTEGAIDAEIVSEPQYRDMVTALNEANYEVNILTSVKVAMDQKKKALEYLTQLHISSYFSKPVLPKDSEFKAQEKRRKIDVKKFDEKVKQRLEEKSHK